MVSIWINNVCIPSDHENHHEKTYQFFQEILWSLYEETVCQYAQIYHSHHPLWHSDEYQFV